MQICQKVPLPEALRLLHQGDGETVIMLTVTARATGAMVIQEALLAILAMASSRVTMAVVMASGMALNNRPGSAPLVCVSCAVEQGADISLPSPGHVHYQHPCTEMSKKVGIEYQR